MTGDVDVRHLRICAQMLRVSAASIMFDAVRRWLQALACSTANAANRVLGLLPWSTGVVVPAEVAP